MRNRIKYTQPDVATNRLQAGMPMTSSNTMGKSKGQETKSYEKHLCRCMTSLSLLLDMNGKMELEATVCKQGICSVLQGHCIYSSFVRRILVVRAVLVGAALDVDEASGKGVHRQVINGGEFQESEGIYTGTFVIGCQRES